MAVGDVQAGFGEPSTLAERWNGLSWAILRTPKPPGSVGGSLEGVSCTSATACTAVGVKVTKRGGPPRGRSTTLAERWNGSTWSIQKTPHLPERNATLASVSCASSSACTAGGEAGYFDGPALVEGWNGSAWSIQPTEGVPNPADASLDAVSCVSSTACTAVGLYYDKALGVNENLALGWNGIIWSPQPGVPPPAHHLNELLSGVSCTSIGECIAVGTATKPNSLGGGPGFAIQWNGVSWSRTNDRALHVNNAPYAVSCVSASNCTAVGGQDGSFVAQWNGTRWSSQPIRHALGTPTLVAVSCPSTTRCIAAAESPLSAYPLLDIGP